MTSTVMTAVRRQILRVVAWALLAAPASVPVWAQQGSVEKVTLAVISVEGDPRYEARRTERAYPGHPVSRAVEGARLGVEDSAFELDVEGKALEVRDVVLARPSHLPRTLAALRKEGVHHIIADLPSYMMQDLVKRAPVMLDGAIVFNTGLADDVLRGGACAPHLLHTYPSQAMLYDGLAQYLSSKSWRNALVLNGSKPADAALASAFERSAKRYGIKVVQEKPFKLSGDPRERDLGNVRLLTSERTHEVVAVMDADGEFARTVPYATQMPRPVVGANGLVPLAWHPQWERFGGPQLSRRFLRQTGQLMRGQDWASWMAARAMATVLVEHPKANVQEQLQALRSGAVRLDGFKGKALSFRSWNGQLRQPVFLTHVDGVVAAAPIDGVLHPKEVMDTLGLDEQENACKTP
ncbi:branched-chain amino acid ABC transporter substrate-binding protein [Hydrogenophaga sp. 5NK40-0174]|uniref:branched-chain amino acid ABC transporter substrate-binding protein n=1 Tax=Hydrogenophaga sp. 5NK40-0174 TaxID=3127649 RepID=UPI00310C1D30